MDKIEVSKDISYVAALNLKLDVYQDPTSDPKGAIIDIHGGGWFRGDKSKDADIARQFAAAGYLVLVPNYRLAPKDLYPAAVDDIESVLNWLEASDYEFSHQKVGVFGSSAGGNLAAEMAIRTHLPAVSWSGVFDIEDWLKAHTEVVPAMDTTQDFNQASAKIDQGGANDAFYKWFILNYTTQDPQKIKDASLIRRVTSSTAPMLLINALNELIPVSGVLKMQAALLKYQVPVWTQFVLGSQHAKGYMAQALAPTLAFFDAFVAQD
ncbi:alpha/beta hydrolase [Lactobacillus sp. CC-MHH1034]|uniref:alpha/beta hydrolase n=1 Tax=Agrilactobacillus fermenti TaxID=2586909 RepID=UPI001E3F3FA8|nr:alpha/beta hydrolase [Agrilactobacillus fermenti]MCD2255568.1 alpha/beta hydrolase [Agrilactobacillus fermenti]